MVFVGGENQMTLFFSSNCSFIIIVLCKLLVRCQLFAQKCLNCQEIAQISNVWGHSAIGNVHVSRDIL